MHHGSDLNQVFGGKGDEEMRNIGQYSQISSIRGGVFDVWLFCGADTVKMRDGGSFFSFGSAKSGQSGSFFDMGGLDRTEEVCSYE